MLQATYNQAGWAYNLHDIPYNGQYDGGNAQSRPRTSAAMTFRERVAAAMTNRARSSAQMTRRDRP